MIQRAIDRRYRWLLPALAVALGLLALRIATGGDEPELSGTVLDGKLAPGFTLTDQRGRTVHLSDFRGKAVALTFLYTNCPDVCPLTAENLRAAYERLPASARDDVALLAVTVDPARDTREALQDFSARHRLADNPNWFALRADPATLEQVWRDYGIDPGTMSGEAAATPGMLAHTDAVYLIDPQGRERVFMRSSMDDAALARNLEALLA